MAQRLVLASASPRRRELLVALQLPFEIVLPPSHEAAGDAAHTPEAIAEHLALAKARAVAMRLAGDAFVIGADTIVVDGDAILGKPANAAAAEAMLRRLAGGSHRVITGLAILNRARPIAVCGHEASTVRMRHYSPTEIARYIARGEPFDKAGGYAIQDPVFRPVAGCDGCYYNVVGLPLCAVADLLRRAGVVVPPPIALERCLDCERCPSAEGVEAVKP